MERLLLQQIKAAEKKPGVKVPIKVIELCEVTINLFEQNVMENGSCSRSSA